MQQLGDAEGVEVGKHFDPLDRYVKVPIACARRTRGIQRLCEEQIQEVVAVGDRVGSGEGVIPAVALDHRLGGQARAAESGGHGRRVDRYAGAPVLAHSKGYPALQFPRIPVAVSQRPPSRIEPQGIPGALAVARGRSAQGHRSGAAVQCVEGAWIGAVGEGVAVAISDRGKRAERGRAPGDQPQRQQSGDQEDEPGVCAEAVDGRKPLEPHMNAPEGSSALVLACPPASDAPRCPVGQMGLRLISRSTVRPGKRGSGPGGGRLLRPRIPFLSSSL